MCFGLTYIEEKITQIILINRLKKRTDTQSQGMSESWHELSFALLKSSVILQVHKIKNGRRGLAHY